MTSPPGRLRHEPSGWWMALVDVAGWVVGVLAASLLLVPAPLGASGGSRLTAVVVLAVALHLVLGHLAHLYGAALDHDDAARSAGVAATAGLVLLAASAVTPGLSPATATVATALAVVLVAGSREAARRVGLRRLRPSAATAERTVVVGAGEGGSELVRLMLRSPASPYLPVALIDDDPRKARRRLHGVPVRGGRDRLVEVLTSTGASTVVIGVAHADRSLIADVMGTVCPLGVDVKVLPSPAELLTRPLAIADVRPVSPADLLGRQETALDLAAISGYLTGRRVLVTGAGGSIGSELCRQVASFDPARLVLLDRDESALHAVQLSMRGRALLDQRDLVVADVRDAARLDAVLAEHRPEVVFHAAALKHLPLLEMYPGEALQTNVGGTANVLRACSDWGVGKMVNISTDKAADPCSVLGYSKRIAERLTSWWCDDEGLTALSVRFGNVLGSRGSVLTTFQEQIRRGGPVTITDREVTRYLMTVEEAVGLVVQAGAVGRAGEVLVLDMGEPVRILEVVQRLMEAARVSLDVQVTGLRRGEKLHEDLFGAGEVGERPVHPMVSHVPVPALAPTALAGLRPTLPDGELVRRLRAACTAPAARPGAGAPAERVSA